MWHASIAYHGTERQDIDAWVNRAMRELHGVGDASLGEWVQHTERATHIRRRLSDKEVAEHAMVMRDIRNTDEAHDRLLALPERLRGILPQHVVVEELFTAR